MEQRQAPIRVETGALDDGRHRGRQLVIGVVGWVFVIVLFVWLARHAGEVDVRLTLFLVSAALVIAAMWTSVAVDLLRPLLIRARRRDPPPIVIDRRRDALGRAVDFDRRSSLTSEFTVADEGGVRRYGSAGRPS